MQRNANHDRHQSSCRHQCIPQCGKSDRGKEDPLHPKPAERRPQPDHADNFADLPEGEQLTRLRSRFLILATGNGDYEAPWESFWVADALGKKGVPNRVDVWEGYRHDWMTWRDMLPQYLEKHA